MSELLEPEIVADWGDFTADFEGRIGEPYLDTHDPPIVTVGLGCAIFSLVAFLALPWLDVTNGPASREAIIAGWIALNAQPGGEVAAHYAAVTGLHLDEDAVDALAQTRLRANAEQLAHTFPDFASWPVAAKRGALSIAWACGAGFPATWPLWSAAARAQDWAGCAANCSIIGNPKRSAATRELFLAAAAA